MFFLDPVYLMFLAPGVLLSIWASFVTKTTFNKYSKYSSSKGYTGADAAYEMLRKNGVHDVNIENVRGFLTDHYDPSAKTLRLSDSVYSSTSLSAIGVACHEAGHALQHANNYAPLGLRSALVPVVNFGSNISIYIIMGGIFLQQTGLAILGCLLFSMAVLFSIVTLPVEWNASSRAKKAMIATGIITKEEEYATGKVLNAAFMTYLAAAIASIFQLLYWLMRSGLLGGNDD